MNAPTYTLTTAQQGLLDSLSDLGWERNTFADPVVSWKEINVPAGEPDPFALRNGDWYLFIEYRGKKSPQIEGATLVYRTAGDPIPTYRRELDSCWLFALNEARPQGIDALITGNRRQRILAVAADPATPAWLDAERRYLSEELRVRSNAISDTPAPTMEQHAWWSAADNLMNGSRALRSANGFTSVRDELDRAQSELDELRRLLDGDAADSNAAAMNAYLEDKQVFDAKYA